jgi:hypothetical protein
MTSKLFQEIEAVIANNDRLIKESEEAIAKSEQFFAEHDINPRESLEFVRKHAGEAAVLEIEARVKETIQQIEDELQRRRMHAPKERKDGQRPVRRRNLI